MRGLEGLGVGARVMVVVREGGGGWLEAVRRLEGDNFDVRRFEGHGVEVRAMALVSGGWRAMAWL